MKAGPSEELYLSVCNNAVRCWPEYVEKRGHDVRAEQYREPLSAQEVQPAFLYTSDCRRGHIENEVFESKVARKYRNLGLLMFRFASN